MAGPLLALLFGYLMLFFWGSAIAARAAGKPVWLFGRARGRDRWAAMGFRAAFVLASLAPFLWLAMPVLRGIDPFWDRGSTAALGVIGVFVAGIGAMLAFAAQMSMGSSWRVGVAEGATGNLVSDGLYRLSRNPTFVGQFMLLAGVSSSGSSNSDDSCPADLLLVGLDTGSVGGGCASPGVGAGL